MSNSLVILIMSQNKIYIVDTWYDLVEQDASLP
jgi:hypothetical protein